MRVSTVISTASKPAEAGNFVTSLWEVHSSKLGWNIIKFEVFVYLISSSRQILGCLKKIRPQILLAAIFQFVVTVIIIIRLNTLTVLLTDSSVEWITLACDATKKIRM